MAGRERAEADRRISIWQATWVSAGKSTCALGGGSSPHTVSAYLGDLHSLMEFLSLDVDASPEQLREALTQRAVRSWLARTPRGWGERARRSRATPRRFATSPPGQCVKEYWRATPRRFCHLRVPTSVCRLRSTNPMRGCFSTPLGMKRRREVPPDSQLGDPRADVRHVGFASPRCAASISRP